MFSVVVVILLNRYFNFTLIIFGILAERSGMCKGISKKVFAKRQRGEIIEVPDGDSAAEDARRWALRLCRLVMITTRNKLVLDMEFTSGYMIPRVPKSRFRCGLAIMRRLDLGTCQNMSK